MNSSQIVAVVREAGFTPSAENEVCVIADRPVLEGVRHVFRAVVFGRNQDHTWRAVMYRKTPSKKAGIAYEYEIFHDAHGLPLRRAKFDDLDDIGIWIGGCVSIPWSRAEVRAIESGVA